MITLENVKKTYGKKKTLFEALKDITLEIPSGEITAIVGKSGSGKSTLMHVMSGLDRATSGDITIDEQSLSKMKQKQIDNFRANKMSFIFQSFFVEGNESCYDNVSLPLEIAGVARSERRKLVETALESVELVDKKREKAKNLSGGQKQRLAIARAIASKPKILFADEPTGNLDSETGEKIEQLLFSYARDNDATLIIVTHDHDIAEKCDRQIFVKDGEITEVKTTKSTPKPKHAKGAKQ